MDDRIVSFGKSNDDLDTALRPKVLADFVGQAQIKENLQVFISAAQRRGETLDHILLYGPPGLGKTTLSNIIANELGAGIKVTSGPAIERAADLATIITGLEQNDVLFIDEIHRLSRAVEEILYPAMEDYALDIVLGKGPGARSIRMALPKFTLIGATTRAGMLTGPLRDRFGIICRLEMYSAEELQRIVLRSADILNTQISNEAAKILASRSRGTPRIANRLLKRIRDFADIFNGGVIDEGICAHALQKLQVDQIGLDEIDKKLLLSIMQKFSGGPVGLETLSAAINEDAVTIEDAIEPYLIQIGFISRTPRGRVAMPNAYKHFGLTVPKAMEEQLSFLAELSDEKK